jgi:hypothetical protein
MNTPVHSITFCPAGKPVRWSCIPLVALVAANLLFLSGLDAQSLQPSDAVAPALRTDQNPTAAITFASGASLKVRSGESGDFPLVAAEPGETVSIQARFPTNLGRGGLVAQALDGGVVPRAQQDSSLAADATASIQFQLPTRPGLYRVLLNGSGVITTLRFWIADAANPSTNQAALRP